MAYFNWLIEAAKQIDEDEKCYEFSIYPLSDTDTNRSNTPTIEDITEAVSDLTKLVKNNQSRTKNGKFASIKYDETKSKYIGVYMNENKWIVCINKDKYRFKTKKEAESYFEYECKKLHINPNTKYRIGYK